jgi:cholesterol oxidase
MPPHFDAVVVGSGFGGSVMACRLAEGGLRVCLLERGKAYPPGSFPRSPADLGANFWDPSEGLHGLFSVWSFKGLEALVSSGLGGGSLIYANVLLRKDEKWFAEQLPGGGVWHWPVTRADLDPHYDEVERRMNAQRFPLGAAEYGRVRKAEALREAAEAVGLDWGLPPLAVTFANAGKPPRPGDVIDEPQGNLHGRARLTCVLCGECDIGCNYGSKNTLDFNYLSAAQRAGAEIHTRAEVRSFGPREGGGYWVEYVHHDARREGRRTETDNLPPHRVTADRLILAAGTLGSTYLLLRNRHRLPALSPALGSRFCGNGDLLGFFLRSRLRKPPRGPRRLDPGTGPVITSYARRGDALDDDGSTGRGFYVQDGGNPEFANWLVEVGNAPGLVRRAASFALRWALARLAGRPRSELSAEIRALLGGGEASSTSLPVLGMGRDVPDGKMFLQGGEKYLQVDWTTETSKDYFSQLEKTMRQMARSLGARFKPNPTLLLRRVITVHPLGGCPMGHGAHEGVVDSWCEVFGHPGLFVADGSVLPGPVGANPSLTIAAVADRAADRILERHRGAA